MIEFHDYKMLFYMYNTARVQPAAHSTTTTSPATPGIYFSVMQYKHHVAISLYICNVRVVICAQRRHAQIRSLCRKKMYMVRNALSLIVASIGDYYTSYYSLATTIPAGTILHTL